VDALHVRQVSLCEGRGTSYIRCCLRRCWSLRQSQGPTGHGVPAQPLRTRTGCEIWAQVISAQRSHQFGPLTPAGAAGLKQPSSPQKGLVRDCSPREDKRVHLSVARFSSACGWCLLSLCRHRVPGAVSPSSADVGACQDPTHHSVSGRRNHV
jgi:hypothetical protein